MVPSCNVLQATCLPTSYLLPPLALNVQQVSWGYNANLGRFTNFVNLMDMAGIAIPSGLLHCDIPSMLCSVILWSLLPHHERQTMQAI